MRALDKQTKYIRKLVAKHARESEHRKPRGVNETTFHRQTCFGLGFMFDLWSYKINTIACACIDVPFDFG